MLSAECHYCYSTLCPLPDQLYCRIRNEGIHTMYELLIALYGELCTAPHSSSPYPVACTKDNAPCFTVIRGAERHSKCEQPSDI